MTNMITTNSKSKYLVDRQHVPESYVCGRHQYSNASCIWDNGMVLASNTTGWFTFIGFSVHGLGCSVPARFIFMLHYFSWIHSVTPESARRANDDDDEVPLHSYKTIYVTRPKYSTPSFFIKHSYIRWPNYKKQSSSSPNQIQMKYFNLAPSYDDPHAIAIYPFDTTQEMYWKACQSSRALMYRERFELEAPESSGVVVYKISMYDLNIPACSCVTLTVQCTKRSQAFLTLRDEINFTPEDGTGGGGNSGNRSPDDIFKVVAITEIMPAAEKSGNDTSDIDPMTHPNSKIEYLHGGVPTGKVVSYDLYIQLQFQGSAELEFQMFGEPIVRGTTDEPADGFYVDPFTFPPDESTGTPIPGAQHGPKQPGQKGPRPPDDGDQQGPPGPPGHGGEHGPLPPGHGGQYGPPPPGHGGQHGPPPSGHGVQSSFGNRWSCDPSILEDLKRNEIGAYGVGDHGNGPPPQGGEGGSRGRGGPGGQGPGGPGHGPSPPHPGPEGPGGPGHGPGPPNQGPEGPGGPGHGSGPPQQGPGGRQHGSGPPQQGPGGRGHGSGPPQQGPKGYDLRRKEEHFWGISQDVVGNTVKWPSLVVDDNLKYEAIGAGQCLNPDTWVTSACCVILLTLFGLR